MGKNEGKHRKKNILIHFDSTCKTQLNAVTVINHPGIPYDINFLLSALPFWSTIYLTIVNTE